jgi:hypothetical protein
MGKGRLQPMYAKTRTWGTRPGGKACAEARDLPPNLRMTTCLAWVAKAGGSLGAGAKQGPAFASVVSEQIDVEEGQGSLVGRVHDVRGKDVAFAGVDLDFAGEVSELAETH